MNTSVVQKGLSAPLGATVDSGGVNFSVFSKNATVIELLLFDDENAAQPAKVIPLDPNAAPHLSLLACLRPGPRSRARCMPTAPTGRSRRIRACASMAEKVLLDPYGLAVAVPEAYDREAASRPGDNAAVAMKSVVADPGRYDWEGDLPLQRPFAETVIYELHVARLHPPSQFRRRGREERAPTPG